MDFDKQFGNDDGMPMERRGRGFTETPAVNEQPSQYQPRNSQKVNTQVKFVVTNRLYSPRSPFDNEGARPNRPYGYRNDDRMGYHRRNPRFQDNRMDFNGNNRPFMYDSRNRYNAGRNNYNNRRNPFRGPRRGGNNRFNRRRPVTEEDLNKDLDKYFAKDPEVMTAKLDGELQDYMQQHVNPAQEVPPTTDNQTQL